MLRNGLEERPARLREGAAGGGAQAAPPRQTGVGGVSRAGGDGAHACQLGSGRGEDGVQRAQGALAQRGGRPNNA